MQYFSGPEQTEFAKEGSPHWGETVEPASVLYLSHLHPLILRITQREHGWAWWEGKKKSSIASLHLSFNTAFRRRWSFSLPWLDAFPLDGNLHYWKETVVHTNSPLSFSTTRTNGHAPWQQPPKDAPACGSFCSSVSHSLIFFLISH